MGSQFVRLKMDSAADTLKDLPVDYHYVFDLVHFILCIQGDRADLGDSFEATSKLHPLASWTSAMLSCFAGGLLVNPLCGEPLLAALGDSTKLAMATLIWFLLYYCPQDLAFQFSKMFPVRIMMYTIKGIYYPKKVVAGMKHAAHVLPGNFLALMVVACAERVHKVLHLGHPPAHLPARRHHICCSCRVVSNNEGWSSLCCAGGSLLPCREHALPPGAGGARGRSEENKINNF